MEQVEKGFFVSLLLIVFASFKYLPTTVATVLFELLAGQYLRNESLVSGNF